MNQHVSPICRGASKSISIPDWQDCYTCWPICCIGASITDALSLWNIFHLSHLGFKREGWSKFCWQAVLQKMGLIHIMRYLAAPYRNGASGRLKIAALPSSPSASPTRPSTAASTSSTLAAARGGCSARRPAAEAGEPFLTGGIGRLAGERRRTAARGASAAVVPGGGCGAPSSPRDVHEVARALIGAELLVDGVGGRDRRGRGLRADDPASHAYRGRTHAQRVDVRPARPRLRLPLLRHPLVPQPRLRARGGRERRARPRARADSRARGDARAAAGSTTPRLLCAGPGRLCQALAITREPRRPRPRRAAVRAARAGAGRARSSTARGSGSRRPPSVPGATGSPARASSAARFARQADGARRACPGAAATPAGGLCETTARRRRCGCSAHLEPARAPRAPARAAARRCPGRRRAAPAGRRAHLVVGRERPGVRRLADARRRAACPGLRRRVADLPLQRLAVERALGRRRASQPRTSGTSTSFGGSSRPASVPMPVKNSIVAAPLQLPLSSASPVLP